MEPSGLGFIVSWCLYYTDTWKFLSPYNSEAIVHIGKVITLLWTNTRTISNEHLKVFTERHPSLAFYNPISMELLT